MVTGMEAKSHAAIADMAMSLRTVASALDSLLDRTVITYDRLVTEAAGLLEPGEELSNPEYLRGMVELICRATGCAEEDKPRVQSAVVRSVVA